MKIASKKLYQRILNMGFAFVLALSSVTASMSYALAQNVSAISGVFPSTNSQNIVNGWGNVTETGDGADSVTLKFTSTRAFWSCFEYRTDGDTSQVTSPTNFNSEILDGLYPYYCQNNSNSTHTITANEYVEVRLSFGDEKDERFDWTRFDVADLIAPTVPEITSPLNGQFFNSSPISNQWSASTDDVSGVSHYQIAYNYDDGHSFGSSTCPGVNISGYSGFIGCRNVTTTSRNHTPGISEQGGVTIWVRAIDNEGNVSAWSDPVHYYYGKSTLDAPTLISPENGAVENGGPTQKWSHNSPSNVDYYIYESYSDAALTDLVYSNTTSNTQRTVGGTQNITIWWRVFAVDKSGNLTAPSEASKLVIDNTAPDTSNIVLNGQPVSQTDVRSSNCSPISKFHTVNGEIDLSATLSDAAGGVNSAKYKVRKVNASGCTVSSVFSSGNVKMSNAADDTWEDLSGFDTNNVPEDGEYTILLQITDTAGNTAIKYIDIVVDNTKPKLKILSPSDEDLISGVFSVLGISTDATTEVSEVSYRVREYNSDDTLGATVVAWSSTVLDSVTGEWSFPVDLPDGKYRIIVKSTDTAGNSRTKRIDVTVDNSGPTVVYAGFAQNGAVITPSFTATDIHEPLTYSWSTSPDVSISDVAALNPEFTVNVDGAYTFELTVTDAAGNITVVPFSFTYTTPETPSSDNTGSDNTGSESPVTTAGTTSNNGGFTDVNANNESEDTEVLGTSTQNKDQSNTSTDKKEVLGTSVKNNDDVWNLFGIAWYWWLLILAAVAMIARWLYGRFSQANA